MRIAYLHCFAGISGDMFLGALVDAGVPVAVLDDATAALNLGATLRIGRVDRSGIAAAKVDVLEGGRLAEEQPHGANPNEHTDQNGSADHAHPDHEGRQEQRHSHDFHRHPETQHLHKGGHSHEHPHSEDGYAHEGAIHVHGRSLNAIRDLIRNAALAEPVKNFAIHAFELLGGSEAKIHNVPIDEIHFHEVGAVDAIVDIVAAGAGIYFLEQQGLAADNSAGPLRWFCSPINVGGGMVECAHGTFPVPAPATADLLRGMPTYSAHVQKELVTPTGAALIRALGPTFGEQPAMRVGEIGYGAGTRNPKDFPNVLRLSLGVADALNPAQTTGTAKAQHGGVAAVERPLTSSDVEHGGSAHADSVTVLETALDDLSPQILAHVTEQALVLGAFDVMTTPVGMKKGRPGTLITILTDEQHSPALERLLLRETSTLGIRVHKQRRICLARHHISVSSAFGDIRIKIGSFDSEAVNAAPEFEDCRMAAAIHGVPVKQVLQAAIAAYVGLSSREPEATPAHAAEHA